MADIQGRLLTQSLIRRLTAQSSVRSSVVVEVLPLLESLVENLGIVDNDAKLETVELLGIDPVRALDLPIESRPARLDVDVAGTSVEEVPVGSRPKLSTVGSGYLDMKRQPVKQRCEPRGPPVPEELIDFRGRSEILFSSTRPTCDDAAMPFSRDDPYRQISCWVVVRSM
jgi:hypothetical protein